MSDEQKPVEEQDSTPSAPLPPKPEPPENIEFKGGDVPTLKAKKD